MIATYRPKPTIARRTATSFRTADVFSLAEYLLANQFDAEPPSKPDVRIYGRFWRRGALCTIFLSGAITCQGDDQAAGVDFLAGLVDEGGQQ